MDPSLLYIYILIRSFYCKREAKDSELNSIAAHGTVQNET